MRLRWEDRCSFIHKRAQSWETFWSGGSVWFLLTLRELWQTVLQLGAPHGQRWDASIYSLHLQTQILASRCLEVPRKMQASCKGQMARTQPASYWMQVAGQHPWPTQGLP